MGKLAGDDRPIGSGRSGGSCAILTTWLDLDADDQTVFLGWVADRGNSSGQLRDRMAEYGYEIGVHAIQRHRRGDCACRRDHPGVFDG